MQPQTGLLEERADTIRIISMGRTIESYYDRKLDTVKPTTQSLSAKYLRTLSLHNRLVVSICCLKDSRDIEPEDRERLVTQIRRSRQDMILVPHGTFTMCDTARFIQNSLGKDGGGKVITVTGAFLIPSIIDSDAYFNLGYAIANLRRLLSGVYVCMNGQTFDPQQVEKNIEKAKYEHHK